MSVGGLVSGMDTQTIISQLMQIEANPQTLLKQRLSATQSQATAYRALNTRFDALRSAAEALTTDANAWKPAKATASSTTVTASASAGAAPGSVTFTVNNVATSHSVRSDKIWTVTGTQTAADLDYGATTLDITMGGTTTTLDLDRDGNGTATLAEAAAAINAKTELGLTATAVRVSPTEYRLQVATSKTGASSEFTVGAAGTFDPVTQGADAKLTVGTGPGAFTMTSSTNTFTGLLDGTVITVSEPAAAVTLKVAADPEALATKVAALVNAANGLLDSISSYTDYESTSAALKGDATLRQLSGQILDTVARALGSNGSLSVAGVELSKDGQHLDFDKATFVSKLTAEPALVQGLFTGTSRTNGPDGTAGTTDDVTTPTGLAARLAALAKTASDDTTGTLTLLAKGKDSTAEDLQDRIDAWDIRLELRRTTLTRQFTAMEVALSSLQNQSSWLSSQISSLPSWNTNSKS
ncbi:flagellar filament capping protein FliD [Geodermatophilus sabuli]|uniref:Flagellar hook-associated protein 2 n=1 Tax=Geodermatophilus sabuli TaxID=1564158 RepID=A0A285EGL3_9ACTN|nr:flagellar filament capping protein FliD [Geodermatophilus sabuli]MBB3083144.1 flagellar hook-associated protein 2 [Geodermatophilus sabuli]SNX98140.1 flagellar hook-associated protein 2 [Geodermatophilus sabuli]